MVRTLAALALLAACASARPAQPVAAPQPAAPPPPPPAPPPPPSAHVRVIHASPDSFAGTVAAFLDNAPTPAVASLAFRSAAGYQPVPAGTHSVQARPPGMPGTGPAPINWNTPELQPGRAYTIVAHGLVSDLSGPQITFTHDEDPMQPAAAGQAGVRFFHALVGGGTVDVCFNQTTPAFVGVAYGTFAAAAGTQGHYAGAQPGTMNVTFRSHAPGRSPCAGRVVGSVEVPFVETTNTTLVAVGRIGRGVGVTPEVLVCTDVAPAASRCTAVAVRAGR